MTLSHALKKCSADKKNLISDAFGQILSYTYDPKELDKDIQRLIMQDSYQPQFSQLMYPYLAHEASHFQSFFDGSEPFGFSVENLSIICNQKMQPAPKKIAQFLSSHHIESEKEKSDFQKAVREEYFGSGFIHRYQTATGKDRLIYLYDMVENPFYTLYTFTHELTHAMQDKKNYAPYGEARKTYRTDYREIHANLTAGTFMMIKALQTQNPSIIQQTKQRLLEQSSFMSNVMKTPKYGVRYFDWKGLCSVLADIPNRYQTMLTDQGDIDWNKLYEYTTQKVLEMDYTPDKIQTAKSFLEQQVTPIWQAIGQNKEFLEKIVGLKGKNDIADDFIDGFDYFMAHPAATNKKTEQFYQRLAKPATRSEVLHSKMNDNIPNIELYRELDATKKKRERPGSIRT